MHAIGHGDRITAPDDIEARAWQPIEGAPAGRKHRMGRLRQAVHADQPRGGELAHAGLDVGEHVAHALRGEGGGELEGCKLVGLVDGAQAAGRVHHQVGGVDDAASFADHPAQFVGDEGRQVERRLVKTMVAGAERFPADRADRLAKRHAAFGEDVGQRRRAVARLPGQAEGLVEHALIGAADDLGIAPALIADQQLRYLSGQQDQQRFLETRVVSREIGDVGRMLAVAIDDEAIEAVGAAARQQSFDARLVGGQRNPGHHGRLAEFGQRDLFQRNGCDRHRSSPSAAQSSPGLRGGRRVASRFRMCNRPRIGRRDRPRR